MIDANALSAGDVVIFPWLSGPVIFVGRDLGGYRFRTGPGIEVVYGEHHLELGTRLSPEEADS